MIDRHNLWREGGGGKEGKVGWEGMGMGMEGGMD